MSGTDYTTTPNLGLFKPIYDADAEQWGAHLNQNADILDTALGPSGTTFLPIAGGTMTGPVTLAGVNTAPNPAVGNNSQQLATTAFVGAAVAAAPVSGPGNVGRNLLHNSLFNVRQRGAGPWTTTSSYTADRWAIYLVSDTVSASLPAANDAVRTAIGDEAVMTFWQNSFTGNAAAGAYSSLQQPIESVRRLAGKTVTLSFWAAGTAGLKLGINYLQNFGTGGSPSAAGWALATGASVTISTTWTRYSVTTTLPTAAGKTIGTNGNDYTSIALAFSSGATNNAVFGNVGVQSGNISLWGVQLEIGPVATPLEKPDPQQDVAKCQRFYQTVTASSRMTLTGAFPVTAPAYWTPMRATPTATLNTAGTRGNVASVSVLTYTNNSGALTFTTVAPGDAYILADGWNLSADL
jgi:hypothetical protein